MQPKEPNWWCANAELGHACPNGTAVRLKPQDNKKSGIIKRKKQGIKCDQWEWGH